MLNPSLRPLPDGGTADKFATEVLQALSRQSKTLPCRFFYDALDPEPNSTNTPPIGHAGRHLLCVCLLDRGFGAGWIDA